MAKRMSVKRNGSVRPGVDSNGVTKYARRAARERRLKAEGDFKNPQHMLSGNLKTGVSLNLPLLNCIPSKRCAESCYACQGHIAMNKAIRKALVIDQMLLDGDLYRLIGECRMYENVRLNGGGDLTLNHVKSVLKLARECPRTIFWGFTRNRPVAQKLNRKLPNLSLVLSFDATSRKEQTHRYRGPLAYGPKRAGEEVPDDRRIVVVFPEHQQSHPDIAIQWHPKDCPGVWGEKLGACNRCRRCFKPFEAMKEDSYV